MKIGIKNGDCELRFSCKNVDTKLCNLSVMKESKILKVDYIECNYYKEK